MPGPDHGGLRVVVDAGQNLLRLLVPTEGSASGAVADGPAPTVGPRSAVLDVGEAGRLLGLEIDAEGGTGGEPWYLELEAAPGRQMRSVPVTVSVARDAAGRPVWVDLPRRGEGYELTFPIGNQCWVRPRRAG